MWLEWDSRWQFTELSVWEHGFRKIIFFLLKINFFIYFKLFWCSDFKNNFKKIKKIILIYFKIKNILKINYTVKHSQINIVLKKVKR